MSGEKYYKEFFNDFEKNNISRQKYGENFNEIYMIEILFAIFDKKLYQDIIGFNNIYIHNMLPIEDTLYLLSNDKIKDKILYLICKYREI